MVSIFFPTVSRYSNLLPLTTRTQLAVLTFRLYILCRRLSTIIVAVSMDPKPHKLKENVTINFRHLKVTTIITTLWSLCAHLVEKSKKKKYKSVLTRLQKVQDSVCFGVAAKKGEDQVSILDRKYLAGGSFLDTDGLFY